MTTLNAAKLVLVVSREPIKSVIQFPVTTTPEKSDHTSIKLRIDYWKDKANGKQDSEPDEDFQPDSLMPFVGNPRQPMPAGLAFDLVDYLELVDWSGRAIRDDKRGAIPQSHLLSNALVYPQSTGWTCV